MTNRYTAYTFTSCCVRIVLLAMLACTAGCPTTPSELRYEPPKAGTPAATVAIGAGKTTHIYMVDGKETPAFASSVLVSAGTHRVRLNCPGPNAIESLTVEGQFQDGSKYFARCEFQGEKPVLWLAGTQDGPPLPEFTGNPPVGMAVAAASAPKPSFWSSLLPSIGWPGSIETAAIEPPKGFADWKVGSSSGRTGRTIAEFVPKEESIDNWTRLMTIQFLEQKGLSPQATMEDLRLMMLKRCPGTQWTVTEQDATSILYEWRLADCAGNPDQYEMARLLEGHDGLQRVAITVKGPGLSPPERAAWLKSLSDAYVVKDGKRVTVSP